MVLGKHKVEANRLKVSLEKKIRAHKNAKKKVKAIEKEMQV